MSIGFKVVWSCADEHMTKQLIFKYNVMDMLQMQMYVIFYIINKQIGSTCGYLL